MQAPRAVIDAISMIPTPWKLDPGVTTSTTMNSSEGVGTNGMTFPIMHRKKTRRRRLPAKSCATQAIQPKRKARHSGSYIMANLERQGSNHTHALAGDPTNHIRTTL